MRTLVMGLHAVALSVVAALLLTPSVSHAQTVGKRADKAHELSLEELVGNAALFSGQPVRLIGVADLSVEFEARPKLYFSREAFSRRTYQYVDVEFSDVWVANYGVPLEGMTGKYVIIEGIFSYEPPERFQASDGGVICVPSCPTNGWLHDINFVSLLEE
jgi:hypothetical protein